MSTVIRSNQINTKIVGKYIASSSGSVIDNCTCLMALIITRGGNHCWFTPSNRTQGRIRVCASYILEYIVGKHLDVAHTIGFQINFYTGNLRKITIHIIGVITQSVEVFCCIRLIHISTDLIFRVPCKYGKIKRSNITNQCAVTHFKFCFLGRF